MNIPKIFILLNAYYVNNDAYLFEDELTLTKSKTNK